MFRLPHRRHDAREGICASTLLDNKTFYRSFITDLRCAKQSVYIDSPSITTRRIREMMPLLRELRRRGVRITVNTRDPKEHDSEYERQARLAVYEMQELGITVLYTVKHHRKLAIIDGEILYEGSLNILSQIDS